MQETQETSLSTTVSKPNPPTSVVNHRHHHHHQKRHHRQTSGLCCCCLSSDDDRRDGCGRRCRASVAAPPALFNASSSSIIHSPTSPPPSPPIASSPLHCFRTIFNISTGRRAHASGDSRTRHAAWCQSSSFRLVASPTGGGVAGEGVAAPSVAADGAPQHPPAASSSPGVATSQRSSYDRRAFDRSTTLDSSAGAGTEEALCGCIDHRWRYWRKNHRHRTRLTGGEHTYYSNAEYCLNVTLPMEDATAMNVTTYAARDDVACKKM